MRRKFTKFKKAKKEILVKKKGKNCNVAIKRQPEAQREFVNSQKPPEKKSRDQRKPL